MSPYISRQSSLHAPLTGLIAGFLAPAAIAMAAGETVIVTTVADVVDVPGLADIGQLPGPDGKVSFREALAVANGMEGPQAVNFEIPISEFSFGGTVAILDNEGGPFQLSDHATTVDFTSQVAFTGDTNPAGNEVGVFGTPPTAGQAAINVSGNDCTIIGLDRVTMRGYGVRISGDDNRVIGCTISGPLYAAVYITGGFGGPLTSGNIIGGTEAGEGNDLSAGNSGVRIDGPADGNIVIGNTLTGAFWGVEVRSATCCEGLVASNNRIGGPTPEERNIISRAGKYGEEGFPDGGQISLDYAIGTIVEGNYIGTTPNGMGAASQRGPVGVLLRDADGSVIRNNLVSGIRVLGVGHHAGDVFGTAVVISGDSHGSVVEGNRIGVAADGVSPVRNHSGVTVGNFPGTPLPYDITIGGVAAGAGNIIARNDLDGVVIAPDAEGISILGNSIHSNGALGIDLRVLGAGGAGVTLNDPGDADTGGNGLQNFPVLTGVSSSGTSTTVVGTFNSSASLEYRLEFFASESCDPSGYGEGAAFLGFTMVTTDTSGDAVFDATLPEPSVAGSFVTATATRMLSGDTSEFSACVTVEGSTPGDVDGDGDVDFSDLLVLLAAWGDCSAKGACPADLDSSGSVDFSDLLIMLASWS